MLLLSGIALVSSSCTSSHNEVPKAKVEVPGAPRTPAPSDLLKEAEVLWRQGMSSI